MERHQKNNRFAIYVVLVFFIFIIVDGATNLLLRLDNQWLDSLVVHQASHNRPDPDIVVIDIDEASLNHLASFTGAWPWPRSVHATLVDLLSQQQPKAIVFDIFFADPDSERQESDQQFIDAISKVDNVFFPLLEKTEDAKATGKLIVDLPTTLNFIKDKNPTPGAKASLIMPNAIPSNLWKVGTVNETIDDDNIERRYDIYRIIEGWRLPALPTRLASYLGFPPPNNQQEFILDWQQPQALIYPTLSYSQVLVNLTQHIDYPSKNYFADKIVIIGSTAINAQTNRATPISAEHPSAQILATAIDNLKNHSFLTRPLNSIVNTLIALLSLLFIFVVFIKSKQRLSTTSFALVGLSIILVVVSYLGVGNKVLIPVASKLLWLWSYFLIIAAWRYGHIILNRQRARALFGRSLHLEALRGLSDDDIKEPEEYAEKTNLTVLCCSIQHFSTFAEEHDAKQLTRLLSDYFDEQVSLIFKHRGTLDNIAGGTLLAFWGAPIPHEKHAEMAVSAAIKMIDNIALFKKKHQLPNLNISIGIHTGVASVGSVGSNLYQHYTAMGRVIGIAKAIKSLIREKSTVVISTDTKNACHDDFHFVGLGNHQLLSEKIDVELFEPKRKYL